MLFAYVVGPRNLSITPTKSTYYVGERLHCSASGNPTPTFEWIEVDTGYAVGGPILILNERMGQEKNNTFQCKAENVVAGEKKTAFKNITIHIAGRNFYVKVVFNWFHILPE